MATYKPEQLGITAKTTGGTFQQGAYYNARQYWNGTLGEIGAMHPESNQQGAGQAVSSEVVAQTNPSNVGYIKAQQLQAPAYVPFSSGANASFIGGLNAEVEKARKSLEESLRVQKENADAKLVEMRKKEQDALTKVGELTQPFREELENTERERLYVNQNFEENQKLVGELDKLLTEGNDYIRQQKEVTGLSAIRNPRIQKSMEEVAARAGVIEAVINARNGQIAQAQNMIDRSVTAIANDRKDRLTYYETVLNLANRDILMLDEESKTIAKEQTGLLKMDLERSQATADYVKQLMINPSTAGLMGEAGISLNDSVETINSKLSQAQVNRDVREQANKISIEGGVMVYDPKLVPASQLKSFTDARGQVHYYKMPAKAGSGDNFNMTEFVKTLKDGGQTNSAGDSLLADVLRPKFAPVTGIGTIYTDPSTGTVYRYTSKGWVII